MKFTGTKDIKSFVNDFIRNHQTLFANKVVIDVPAGTGITSTSLLNCGAKVEAFDLFPAFFKENRITCNYCDLTESLPLADNYADYIICQEGIEHFSDQIKVLKEINRVLKPNGILLITTPNYSNIKAKLSYLFAESEYVGKLMPPNELDDVWYSEDGSNKIYYGHLFLIGIQKLRVFSKMANFSIKEIHSVRANMLSTILLPLFYPLIIWLNKKTKTKALNRHMSNLNKAEEVYGEIYKLNTHIGILRSSHLFVELKKDISIVSNWSINNKIKSTDSIT